MNEREELVKLVNESAQRLIEHCDSVQIFITRHNDTDDNTTMSYEFGMGNFYARQGQVAEWMICQQQYQKNWADEKDKE